jgi:3-hydroxy acid dehydrogenase/malonic semialdehyde reductase
MRELDISGFRVLVTGASSGIGAACARAFAERGCRVAMVARRGERLRVLADLLEAELGVGVLWSELDVRDRGAVDGWFAGLPPGWSDLEILVNNAGLARGLAPLQGGAIEDWEEMIDTNIKGLLYVTRQVVSRMVAARRGHVINIGSIAGHEVYPGGNVYCATKHAVTALTRALAIDTLGTGVRVSSVDPGMVDTEFSLVRFHGDSGRADAVYRGLKPLAGDDVADAVVYCATRPAHATVRELVLMPAAQAAAVHVHREAETAQVE